MGSPAELKISPRGPQGANFWVMDGNYGRLFRFLFESVFLGRFGVDFCNIVAAVRARSAAEVEAAEGGEASPPSSAGVGFNVFAFLSSTPCNL